MREFKSEQITLINCVCIPNDVTDYICEEYDYGCHYDHTVLQVEDDGGLLAEWLKKNGYVFKYHTDGKEYSTSDSIAFYGT
jgi:hypothetical protein